MIAIPAWLVTLLESLHWTIISWDIDVGGPVLRLLQWVVDIINTITQWAGQIGDFIAELIQEIRDAIAIIIERIEAAWQWILNFWDTLGDWVANWWAGMVDTVKGWIQIAQDFVLDLVKILTSGLEELRAKWDDFWVNELPSLVRRFEVENLVANFLSPFRDLFNFWGDRAREILAFFADPYEFINSRLIRWLDLFLRRYL